jgi:hypothetical protein
MKNSVDVAKLVIRGKFIVGNVYIKNEKGNQMLVACNPSYLGG